MDRQTDEQAGRQADVQGRMDRWLDGQTIKDKQRSDPNRCVSLSKQETQRM